MKSNNTFSVDFIVRKSKYEKQIAYLFARITVNGTSREISLKQKMNEGDWDSRKEQIRGKRTDVQAMNNFIDKVRFMLTEIYRGLVDKGNPFTVDHIKDIYLGRQSPKETDFRGIIELFQYHNDTQKHLLAAGTMKNYHTTLTYLERFIIALFTKKDFPLDKLDYAFIEQFEYFIRNTPIKSHDRCEGNGVYKHMERLCKVVGLGRRLKWMNTNPFMDYRKHPTKPQRKALDIKELGKIVSQEFTDSQIAYIQDLFLFSCYTGLAYADVTTLKTSNLYRSNDGNLWLDKYREKSSELSLVPLLTDAINILNRYWDGNSTPDRIIFPYVSNQEVNRNLKIIRATCGISKEITFHIARHTFATTVTLKNGVPIETVSKMLGHTKLSTTQIYAKVDEEKIAKDMASVQDLLDKAIKIIWP